MKPLWTQESNKNQNWVRKLISLYLGKTVTMLEYEAYPSMALKTMLKIVNDARQLSLSGAFSSEWSDPSSSSSSTSATAQHNHSSPSPSPSHPPPPKLDLVQQAISTSSLSASVALVRISLMHRLGIVGPQESSISICVSSPHRREAFRACEWILEQVKLKVEIWKREVYEGADTEDKDKAWKENFPKE